MYLPADVTDAAMGGGLAAVLSLIFAYLYKLYRTRHKMKHEDAVQVQVIEEKVSDQWKRVVKEQDRRYDELGKKMDKVVAHLEGMISDLRKEVDKEKEEHRLTLRKYDQLLVAVRNQAKAIRSYERAMKEAQIPYRPFEVEDVSEEAGK